MLVDAVGRSGHRARGDCEGVDVDAGWMWLDLADVVPRQRAMVSCDSLVDGRWRMEGECVDGMRGWDAWPTRSRVLSANCASKSRQFIVSGNTTE